jgi:hypothetical protein
MTGYLQRLVRTATQPAAESVHPWTGSVFSPGRPETYALAEESKESVPTASPVQSRGTVSFESPQRSPAPAVARITQSSSNYTPLVSEVEPPPARGIPVWTKQHTSRKSSIINATAPEIVIETEEEFPEKRASAPGELTTPPSVSWTSSAESAEHSLMGIKPNPGAPKEAFRTTTRPLRPAYQTQDARSASGAGRQADDIQIHIGRIEVTAVPPPAPRVVKPPEKGPSLDAYLKRREGRAR